jgi:hypothetical protein
MTDAETQRNDPLPEEQRTALEELRRSDDPELAQFADKFLQSIDGGE